jgi:hypothetical protein
LCRPISVGAIDPVGMTNASASNVRNKNASTNAITIDSTVSRSDWAVETSAAPFFSDSAAAGGFGLLVRGFLFRAILSTCLEWREKQPGRNASQAHFQRRVASRLRIDIHAFAAADEI